MNKESIEFKAPEGMEVPEGINPGDTFEVMATVQLGEDGELYLKEVDGMPVGSTPLVLPDVTAGSHTVRIEMPGYRPWITTITLSRGMRSRVGASLEP